MKIQKRTGHAVLYLSTTSEAVRLPAGTPKKTVTAILSHLPPGTPARRRLSINALKAAGIAAS